MLYFFTGTPGSGKSLHVARMIEMYIKRGKNVVANFEVAEEFLKHPKRHPDGRFVYVNNIDFGHEYGRRKECDAVDCLHGFAANFHKLDNGQMIEDQTLLVLDEAQILFNARTWQDPSRPRWTEFFTQHRKYGFTVVIITQMDRLVDRQIRGCFEYNYIHRKVNNYKAFGKFLAFFCGGNLFICIVRWQDVKGRAGKVSVSYFIGRKKYYRLYNSAKIFTAQAQGAGVAPGRGPRS